VKTLKQQFNELADKYIAAFEKKHGAQLEFWVADDKSGIASFGGTWFVNFSDIMFDIDNNLPKRLIFDWLDYSLETHYYNENKISKLPSINLKSYSKGVRHEIKF